VRWAARYAVVDELWRGRARVIVDPMLEAVLRDGGPGVAHGSDPALRQLVDDLVPAEPIEGEPVWMAVATAEVAAELGPARQGTTFVPLPAIADVIGRAHWDVALVDLSADLDPQVRGGAGDRAATALDELGVDGARGRTVVLSVPVRDYPRTEHGLDYDEMATLVVEQLGGGRLYGLYAPPMVAVVEFGDLDDDAGYDYDDDTDTLLLEDAEQGEEDAEEDAYDDDVPLTYDNTLGSQDPRLLEYIAIAGADAPIEGLALVELPELGDDDDGGARTQLAQARRQADLAAIDRQTQLERAEGLERDNAELRRQVDELREQLADARDSLRQSGGPGAVAAEVALQAALSREQALRWRVGELEDALAHAMSRPVDELEAELARLREQVRRGVAEAGNGRPAPGSAPPSASASAPESSSASAAESGSGSGPGSSSGSAPGSGSGTPGFAGPGPAPAVGGPAPVAPVRLRLEALVRRIERGGIGTLELRRELVAIARRLQPQPH
jgi:hypothetical protein